MIMSNTDTTTTAATPAASTNLFQQIEAQLSAEWSGAAAFFKTAETDVGAFLTKVAAGAEIVISDIESIGQYVAGHLTVIQAGIATIAGVAATVAPNNTEVQKAVADLSTAANDVATLSTSLSSGTTSGDPAVVATAVAAINAVKQLSQIAGTAGSVITTLAGNSPTATQTVTPGTPAPAA
jgi:hypothetical protein